MHCYRRFTHHDLPTVVASLANLVGSAIGQILPTLFVTSDSMGSPLKDGFFRLMLTSFIMTWVGLFLAVVSLKEAPPTPASALELARAHNTRASLRIDADSSLWASTIINAKELLKNVDFLILCGAFGFGLGKRFAMPPPLYLPSHILISF